MFLEFTIPLNEDPVLIKKYLLRKGVSKHLWRRLTQQNCIFLNGIPVNGTLITAKPGDKLTCRLKETSDIVAANIPFEIIYEDQHILAINKPSGLLVHPVVPGQTDTLANAVQYYYEQSKQDCIFHPVHRLDKYTSGLLIIAKTPFAQHIITGKAAHPFHREYLAIAENKFIFTTGRILTSISRKKDSNILREINSGGRPAVTQYCVLKQNSTLALVHLLPATGRTHQLRIHLSSIGHPIYGDDLYGAYTNSTNHQALHSYKCTIIHPVSKQPIFLTAAIPADMRELISQNFPTADI